MADSIAISSQSSGVKSTPKWVSGNHRTPIKPPLRKNKNTVFTHT